MSFAVFLLGSILGSLLTFNAGIFEADGGDIKFLVYVITAITSITALLFSIYHARTSIHHNELSLIPRLTPTISDFTNNESDELFEIEVTNNGLGPAEITGAWLELISRGDTKKFRLDADGIDAYLGQIFRDDLSELENEAQKIHRLLTNIANERPFREYESFARKELIASNSTKKVLRVELPVNKHGVLLTEEQKKFMRNKARNALLNTKLEIRYQSLHNKPDKVSEYLIKQSK